MMELREFRPTDPRLWPYIDRYSILETSALFPGMPKERSLPDGFVKLFFYFSQGCPLYTDSQGRSIDWNDGVGGHPTETNCDIALPSGKTSFFWVSMHPTFFKRLFGVPIYYLNNNITSLECLIGEEGKWIKERVGNTRIDMEKVDVLDSFFLDKIKTSKHFEYQARHLSHVIHSCHGQLDIGTLAKKERISIRTFQRRFLDEMGLTPKYYSKIVRFNYVTSLVKRAVKPMSWHDVVSSCGYFDQAHLIHDVKSLTGQSPSVFFSHQPLISDFHLGRESGKEMSRFYNT